MSKTITLTVPYGRKKEKEYEISVVPNRFTVDYAEYRAGLLEVIKLQDELKDAKTKEDIEAIKEKADLHSIEKTFEKKLSLIETIMIANEYEYEREFWDMKVNPNDVTEFIDSCAVKDLDELDKKKLLLSLLRRK